MDPNPVAEPEAQPEPPPLWVEIKNTPDFKALTPEKQLVTFARWHDDAFNHLSKQPDWSTSAGEFNTRAAQEQDALQKAAGVTHPDEARVKIGQEAVAALSANGQPVTHAQERNALQPFGPDVWKAYLNHRTGADQAPETTVDAFGHEVANAYREAGASLAKSIANTSAFFTTPDKPGRSTEDAMHAFDSYLTAKKQMLEAMPPDHPDKERLGNEVAGLQADRPNVEGKWNARTEAYTNAVTDLHNTLENIDPMLHVDPKLKNTLPAQAARLAAGVGLAIGEASIPGVGLPLLLTQSSAQAYGQTLDATNGDEEKARNAMVRSLAANLVFMGMAHGANSGLAKALEKSGAGPLQSLAVRLAGGSAANIAIGQGLAGAEAAAEAPEGQRYEKFMEVATKPDFDNIAQGIAFGMLGSKPMQSILDAARATAEKRTAADKAQAQATASVAPQATALRETGSPKTADALEANAVADAQTALTNEGIRLTSRTATPGGDYQHDLSIPETATLEQLQEFRKNVDTSHLPPEAAKAVLDQLDGEIARKGEAGTTPAAPATAEAPAPAAEPATTAAQPQEAAGPNFTATGDGRFTAEFPDEAAAKSWVNANGERLLSNTILTEGGKTTLTMRPKGGTEARVVYTAIRDSANPENIVHGEEWNSGHDTFTRDALEAGIEPDTLERGFIVRDADGTERFVSRQEAAPIAAAAGQAAPDVTNLRSQDLIEQAKAARRAEEPETRAVVAPENDRLAPAPESRPVVEPAPAPTAAQVARAHPRTPEEKAAALEQGTVEVREQVTDTGVVPTTNEIRKMIGGDPTAAAALRKEMLAHVAEEYPLAKAPEGSKVTTDKHPVTREELPSTVDAAGKVSPMFTNDPQITAQQIDIGAASHTPGARLYIPEDMPASQVNPSIRIAKEKGTGRYYVIGADAKLPDGRTVKVEKPDDYTPAYQESRRLVGDAQKPLGLKPETLQQVAKAVEQGIADRKLDFGPLEFDLEDAVDPGEAAPAEGEVKLATSSEPSTEPATAEGVTKVVLDTAEKLSQLGIGKPSEVENPMGHALKQLAKDNTIPATLRVLAKQLLKAPIDWSKVRLTYFAHPESDAAGYYTNNARVEHGHIQINAAATHPGGVSATLLHEAVHHGTMLKLADNYKRTKTEQKAFDTLTEIYNKVLAEVYKSETGKEGTPEEHRKFAKAQGGDKRIKNYRQNSVLYGISNMREFVAEALTSGRFQRLLSTFEAPAGSTTIKGKIGNVLNAMRDALKSLFAGVEIKKGSELDRALESSFALLKERTEQGRIGQGRGTSSELRKLGGTEVRALSRFDLEDYAIETGKLDAETMSTMTRPEILDALGYGDTPTLLAGADQRAREGGLDDGGMGNARNGWLGPDGKFHEVGPADTHEDLARRTLIPKNPKLKQAFGKAEKGNRNLTPIEGVTSSREPVVEFMNSKGYVRVAEDWQGAIYFQGKPTASQLRLLRDKAIETGSKLIQDMGSRDRVLYQPDGQMRFTAEQKAAPRPEIVHDVGPDGKATHRVDLPAESSPEQMRSLLDVIAKSPLPDAEKQRLTAEVGAKLESYPTDTAARRLTELQEQISKQPEGATAEQSAEIDKIMADLPDVVDHPQVQKSAQALGIVPGYLNINEPLVTLKNAARNYFRSRKPSEWWAAWLNAADNKSAIFARQKVNDVRGVLREALSRANAPASWKDIVNLKEVFGKKNATMNHRDESALSFVVEAKGDIKNLAAMRTKIENALASPPPGRKSGWTKAAGDALKAIDFATANFPRLSVAADLYTKMMQDQVRLENAGGMPTNYREGYVPHLQEVETGFDTLFGGGVPNTAGTGFKQMRTHDTFADSIAAGVTPKTLNAAVAMENRIQRGMKTLNRRQWAESGKGLTDPTTNQPVVREPIVTKHPVSGDSITSAPPGYQLKLMGGKQIAVHEGYSTLYDAFTRPSTVRDNPVGAAALKTAGFVKHGLLLFDTFHLGRLAFYQAGLRGKGTFSKGLMSLDYSNQELQNMERRGQLPSGVKASDIIARKDNLHKLIDAGYNLGGVQEAMNSSVIRNLRGLGDFNKFVFDQYQRGGMAESGLIEFERQRKAFPELSEQEVARKVAKELNTRFGNLRKEGWFKSDTWADLAQLALLAPHWNEGLLKSEFGAAGQTLKAGKDLAVGYKDPTTGDRTRTLRAGSLLKGSGTMLLGTLVMNQIINYITRGHPTWENPEEGVGSKLSAWIPDKIGGGPGFFLNPMTLPAEITHQVMEVIEKGATPMQALAQVAGYKLSPIAQAAATAKFRTDKFGKPLATDADVMKEMIGDVLPLPIFGQAAYAAAKSIGERKVREPFKGAIEKQLFSIGGVKLSGSPSDRTRIALLAKEFNKSKGIIPDPRFNTSDFTRLTQAIENNDNELARKEFDKLALTKTQKQIDDHYEKQVTSPYTHSGTREGEFYDSLSPEQKKVYDRSVKQREALRDHYYELNFAAPEPTD